MRGPRRRGESSPQSRKIPGGGDRSHSRRLRLSRAGGDIAEQARTAALQANRDGEYDAARRIIRDVIHHLRALALDHPAIEVLIARLRDEERELGEAMAPLAMKARHFERYAVAYSRDPEGKSKRRR